MKKTLKYLNFILLAIGAILASSTDGSNKTIGIVFMVFSATKLPSIKSCNINLKR